MFATRSRPLASLSTIALAAWLGSASTGLAQATKTRVEPAQAKPKAKAAGTVDLNSATAEELMTLPGIGDAYARRIIEARPHKAVADLAQAGIPSTTVDKLGSMAVVRPLPPAVDVNEATPEQLQALPGIGPVLAKEIVASRPYARYDDLAKLKGFGPAKLDELRGRLKFGRASAEPQPQPKARMKKAAEAPSTAPGGLVNLNRASKDELDTLPGIGPALSEAIINARPFATIEDVMKVKGIKDVEFGKIKNRITVK